MMFDSDSLQARDVAFHLHHQTDLKVHERDGPVFVATHGNGVYICDDEGREILDGLSGLGCMLLGYSEPRLVEAAYEQYRKLPFGPTFYGRSHTKIIELAEKLVALAPVPMSKAIFHCCGSTATEMAVKLVWYRSNARGEKDRKKIVGRLRGFHGTSIAAVSLSGQPHMHAGWEPIPLDMFRHLSTPNYYRFQIDGENEQEFSHRMAAEFEQLILDQGPDTIAAFVAEPAMSGGGAIFPPEGYWAAMQEVIRKYGLVFVVDEVVCGFGRTGNLWGSQTYGLEPDMIVCAKGLTGGYFPMSAVLINDDIYESMVAQCETYGVFGHGLTHSGNPVGAAIALETLAIYEERDILGHVRKVEPRFQDGLRALLDHPLVGDVQGAGLFGGMEVVKDKKTREPFDPSWKVGVMVQDSCHDRGLYFRAVGDRLLLTPPVIISESEIDHFLEMLKGGLDDAWEAVKKKL